MLWKPISNSLPVLLVIFRERTGSCFFFLLALVTLSGLLLIAVRLRADSYVDQCLVTAHVIPFRASQEPVKWQDNAAPVTEQSIAAAISWIENLTFERALSQASHLDALLEAGKDKTVSVYPELAEVPKVASS